MSKSLGGWIHTFAVTETSTHKNGYTVYKITSVVFPRSVPEALTCITVWKRFHDVKRLYRELSKRHKTLLLRGRIPEIKDKNYFKRFDPEVIQARKNYVLQLLDFAAQHPALYKSHAFLSFFENGHTPNTSPSHKGNIETICDDLDLYFDTDINLIDPNKDSDDVHINSYHKNSNNIKEEPSSPTEQTCVTSENDNESDGGVHNILTPQISFDGDDNDYIYEAAYEFSRAVQAEVNQEYRESYERYQSGVSKLLTGSKDDTNEERKFIAKAKITKYATKAEEILEKHLLTEKENTKKTVQLSIDLTNSSDDYLERPWNQLSKYKVMKVIDSVMQVQDITEKSIYIMKAIEKPSTNSNAQSIFLPQRVSYMVRLMGFFQSETAIYLLLQQAKGGKLFNYIRTYSPNSHRTTSLSEIFSELELDLNTRSDFLNNDSSVLKLISEYENSQEERQHLKLTISAENSDECEQLYHVEKYQENGEKCITLSHDTPLREIDINSLVTCSQKLLMSVSSTIEESKKNATVREPIIVESKSQRKSVYNNDKSSSLLMKSPQNTVGKKSALPEVSIKRWARELVTAIESLHLKGVILGDLHPDNLLLGSNGQLLLSYFYQNEGPGSNLQFLVDASAVEGLYVAPERPLTIKSDWWSFGVILFEMLTGYTFISYHPGGLASYFEIQYPNVDISEEAKDLLNLTLQCNPEQRFGVEKIKAHKFFEGTDWESVAKAGINSL